MGTVAVDELVLLVTHEPVCESMHRAEDNNTACGGHVEYRIGACEGAALVCEPHVANRKQFAYRGGICAGCDMPALDCWTFRKV